MRLHLKISLIFIIALAHLAAYSTELSEANQLSERCLFSYIGQEHQEVELAKYLTKVSNTNISLLTISSLKNEEDSQNVYKLPDLKHLEPQEKQKILIEQFGKINDIKWIYQISQQADQMVFALYSLKYPIYIGFSFSIQHYLKTNLKTKKIYTKERLQKLIKQRAVETLQVLWEYWPLFARNRIAIYNGNEIALPVGYFNSNMHLGSQPIVIGQTALSSTIDSQTSPTITKIKLPILLQDPPLLINWKETYLGGEEVSRKVRSGHIQDNDLYILTNNNLLIEWQEKNCFLKWGIIKISDLQAFENSKWTNILAWKSVPSSVPETRESFYISISNFIGIMHSQLDSGLKDQIQIKFNYLQLTDFNIYTQIRQSLWQQPSSMASTSLQLNQSVSLGVDYIFNRPTQPMPSSYVGLIFRWDHAEQSIPDNQKTLNVEVPYLNDVGLNIGGFYMINRHTIRFEYSPRFTIGVDIMGHSHVSEVSYLYQFNYQHRFLTTVGLDLRRLNFDFYINKKTLLLGYQTFYALFGLEW